MLYGTYLTYFAGRSAPSDGHWCSKFIHCQRTPDTRTCKKIKELICRAKLERFDPTNSAPPRLWPSWGWFQYAWMTDERNQAGDVEVIDLWEEGDRNQDVRLYKRVGKTSLEGFARASVRRMIGGAPTLCFQGVQEIRGYRILACGANGSVTFQPALNTRCCNKT